MTQPYFDEINVGEQLPDLVKHPTPRQLVMYAGASGDFNPIHYNKDVAVARGLPGIVVHGQLVACFLAQLVTGWMGERGELKKFTGSYKALTLPDEPLTCRGVITKKLDSGQAVLNIWAENPRGEKTVTGTATVLIPNRSAV